jgi:uncharacterized protein YcbX
LSRRAVEPEFAQLSDQVSLADAFPFLLISEASLEDLNMRHDQPVTMEHFRPNLVVSGCEAFAEDQWQLIRIGEITFRVVKPCARCVIPNIDPETGQSNSKVLLTLSKYRRRGEKIYFGQNLLHDQLGELQEGMPIEVLA